MEEKAEESQDSRSLDQTLTVKEDEIHLLKFTSIPLSEFTEIELKSLILAQIERWRHALHMQVERQHRSLLLMASGERVSNISERALEWGITSRKTS